MELLTSLATVKAYLNVQTTNDDAVITRLIQAVSSNLSAWLGRTFTPTRYLEYRNGQGQTAMSVKNFPILAVSNVQTAAWGVIPVGTPVSPLNTQQQPGYYFDRSTIYLQGYNFETGVQNVLLDYTAGTVASETDVIPGTPYQITVSPPGLYLLDQGVVYADTGVALIKVTTSPTLGQYSVSGSIYTLAAADSGASVIISYGYVPETVEQAAIKWVAVSYRERAREGLKSRVLQGESESYVVQEMPDEVAGAAQPYRRMVLTLEAP